MSFFFSCDRRRLNEVSEEDGHVHDVEAALGVIRILFKLHHAFLDAKRDDKFGLGRQNKFGDRYDVLSAALVTPDVVQRCVVGLSPQELGLHGIIAKKSNSYCKLVHVGLQTADEVVLSDDFEGLVWMTVLKNVEEGGVFGELVVRAVPLRAHP